jgi:hypothetical protein
MKHKILLLIISGVLLCMIYCRKGNTGNTDALTGKWQEVKLRTYTLDSGKITHDTTDLNSFTKLDYVQFNGKGTCEISVHEYYFTPQGVYINSQSIDTGHYTAIGNGKFTLNIQSTLQNPGGFTSADTISEINSNSILIHNVFNVHVPGYEAITDAYYQK